MLSKNMKFTLEPEGACGRGGSGVGKACGSESGSRRVADGTVENLRSQWGSRILSGHRVVTLVISRTISGF